MATMPAVAFVDTAGQPHSHVFPWTSSDPSPPSPATSGAVGDRRQLVPWTPDLSSALYKVERWGAPYFAVNAAGDIAVRPHGAATLPIHEIDLYKVVKNAVAAEADGGLGLRPPLLVRFPDVLRHRLESLQASFDAAIAATGYMSHYQGVYPVKCNQDRHVVEDIVAFGAPFRFGLEAGSKPELLLAMSCLTAGGGRNAFLVCNGYKDEEYIALALMARAMGLNTIIVLEQEEELDVILDVGRRIGVRPVIGVRAKLRTKHGGHFGSTCGENGKFGLTVTQILSVVAKLRCCGMLDCLQLLHFHIGSQIPNTALLADGVVEATQIYCELVKCGAVMRVIDVGGGLGVDYDGSRSGDTDMSVAYGLEEYATAVVRAVQRVCDRKGVAHPIICSESGRALVSHHSVLVFEAVTASVQCLVEPGTELAKVLDELGGDARADYRNLVVAAMWRERETCSLYAEQLKRHSVEQFKDGCLGLEHLSAVDELCDLVVRQMGPAERVRTYHINLSVFTSMPDVWAIGQLFPVVPIHHLAEQPIVNAVLSDLTCDSDGKVDRFIGEKPSLPLHDIKDGGEGDRGHYYLGMFLGGAYQEALGGMHNLFGRASVLRVVAGDGPGGFRTVRATPGQSCADVLRIMQHEPELMVEVLTRHATECGLHARVTGSLVRAFGSTTYLVGSSDSGACVDAPGSELVELSPSSVA